MSGKVFFILLLTIFLVSYRRFMPEEPRMSLIVAEFKRAERLYNQENSNGKTDSASLSAYSDVLLKLIDQPRNALMDSLRYQSYYKSGVLSEVNKQYAKATDLYLNAVSYASKQEQKIRMYVFAGAGYYNQNNFDSSSFFLLRAEENSDKLSSTDDRMRLYNTLGVLYFDNGNFFQSKNYFTQALRLTKEVKPVQEQNIISIQLNMAICYFKLGMFDKALELYREIARYKMLSDELYMNMGITYSRTHRYAEAIDIFKKVKQQNFPGVLNEMARAYMESGKTDSALIFIKRYDLKKKILAANALEDGINMQYFGDLELFNSNPDSALKYYQRALILLSKNFTNSDIRVNPVNFTGSFAYLRIFDVLDKKAEAWTALYSKTNSSPDLKAAYATYQSTISLLSYIEKSYETDDAKIFLKEKMGAVYTKALNVCLALDKLFPGSGYLEEAFMITEKNKASVMSAEIKQKNFAGSDAAGGELLREERNIRYNLARLNSKMDQRLTGEELNKVNDELSVYESRLVGLRRKMEENKKFYQMKYADDFPSVKELQSHLSAQQALISFYNSHDAIEIFILKKSSIHHVRLNHGDQIRSHLNQWIEMMQLVESGRKSHLSEIKMPIYNDLVKPILGIAGDEENWIIVPDGLFFLLSFESLPGNEAGDPLIEQHEISYEFSARFILGVNKISKTFFKKDVLSFAPFSASGAHLENEGMGYFAKLAHSKDEISGLAGAQYVDSQATKAVFIKNLNHYPILHLATHAVADLDNPSSSFVVFFPVSGLRSEDFLFQQELYGLTMDSCQLVVISACETGRGKLVSDEGVMSFARAFLYAGCPSTINTLWKADDQTTALIIKGFYHYLEDGYSKSTALRKAKLDFIHTHPIYRNPAYWAHLVLTGNPDALYEKKRTWMGLAFGISFSTILFFAVHRIRKKSRRFPQ